jgi:hypothetical protein
MTLKAHRSGGSTEQYLAEYAEPESAVVSRIEERFTRAIVVPLYGEASDFIDGYLSALRHAQGRTLCIVVVNGALDSATDRHEQNARCMAELLERVGPVVSLQAAPPIWLGAVPGARTSVLLIDRQSEGARLPKKQGVGLARRIGCDVALALHRAGQLESPWLATSDADVELPVDYFAGIEATPPLASAVVYPFRHVPRGAPDIDGATALYEIFLRYYVLGLARALSPYAFHTIGSTLALRADCYAMVRGFPKRAAGEDFYILNKIAKVGPISRPRRAPVRIRARSSSRVPFGTGRAVARICEERAREQELTLYHPRTFELVAALQRCLVNFARTRDFALAERAFEPVAVPRAALSSLLNALSLEAALKDAAREAPNEAQLQRRIHTWFDAFRCLKFVHAIRAELWPEVNWRTALGDATFTPDALLAEMPAASVAERLAVREQELPSLVGPSHVASLPA